MDHGHAVTAMAQPDVVIALLLGLMGSLSHCVTMCGAVTIILGRAGATSGWRLPVLHAGRLLTYALLGGAAGIVGKALTRTTHEFQFLQGVFALMIAGSGAFFVLALLGMAPSPELLFPGLTRRWGEAIRQISASQTPKGLAGTIGIGMMWGMLPCGLVMTALLIAVAAPSPLAGAADMLAFGVGTLPALAIVGWFSGRPFKINASWPRAAAAIFMMVFAAQMMLRGLAAWGWIGHAALGEAMLW